MRNTLQTKDTLTGALLSGTLMPEEPEPERPETSRQGLLFRGADTAIQLGTVNTIVYLAGKGIVLNEPSVALIDTEGIAYAFGRDAIEMSGRQGGEIVRPLSDGVVNDPDSAAKMLRHFLTKAHG